ncbi:MAG TPA: DUF1028 domain-containing protein [Gaiellales bacterium]|jgi:uncharacterized Ntn-hydrolase superfamily protein
MTFSLAGLCERTGMVGVVVSSSSPAVAARCAHARAGVGAAASQNITDPRLGPRMLDLIAAGVPAGEAVSRVAADAPHAAYRQLTAVDTSGSTAVFCGEQTLGLYGFAERPGAVAAGNLLGDAAVPGAMVDAFLAFPDAHIGDRLVAALAAGLEAGGEAGQVRSAGMLVCDREPWPVTDLRVDWDDEPVERLAQLWKVWKPQAEAYVTRALNPEVAPSYGVPGDE